MLNGAFTPSSPIVHPHLSVVDIYGTMSADEASPKVEPPGNFRWFDDEHRVAGFGAPTSKDHADFLKSQGITMVINVLSRQNVDLLAGIHNVDGKPLDIPDLVTSHNIRHLMLPIDDDKAPTDSQIRVFLNTVRHELESGGKVGIHCLMGIGRTNTMGAIWLLDMGVPFQKVKADISSGLEAIESSAPHIFESREQYTAVKKFIQSKSAEKNPIMPPPPGGPHLVDELDKLRQNLPAPGDPSRQETRPKKNRT